MLIFILSKKKCLLYNNSLNKRRIIAIFLEYIEDLFFTIKERRHFLTFIVLFYKLNKGEVELYV